MVTLPRGPVAVLTLLWPLTLLPLAGSTAAVAETPTSRIEPSAIADATRSTKALAPRPITSDLSSISEWEEGFRERMIAEHAENLAKAQSADSFMHYQLAYAIDGFVALYDAVGNREYLDRVLAYISEVMHSATVSSDLPKSQYRDNFKGWGASKHPDPKIDGEEYPLFESYLWRYIARLLRVMKDKGTTLEDAKYKDQYDRILSFLEMHIFDKWYERGLENIYRSRTHMASHWAYISMELARVTEDDERKEKAETIVRRIDQSLRAKMVPHPTVKGGYFWDQLWQRTSLPGQDVAHGNGVVAYLVEAAELEEGWSLDDMRALSMTFLDAIWRTDDGRIDYAAYVDGSGKGTGWFSDGFIKLGRFDSNVQERLEGHTVGRSTQFFGNAALNAKRLGVAYD